MFSLRMLQGIPAMVITQEGGICCQILFFVHICKSPQLSTSKATANLRRALAKQTSLHLLFGQRNKPGILLLQLLSSACKEFAVILQQCQVHHWCQESGKRPVVFQVGVIGKQHRFSPGRCSQCAKTQCVVYTSALTTWDSQSPSSQQQNLYSIPREFVFRALFFCQNKKIVLCFLSKLEAFHMPADDCRFPSLLDWAQL